MDKLAATRPLNPILESKMATLIVGFLLTGVVGHFLTTEYDGRRWERERRLELLTRSLDETQQEIDEVTLRMRERWYTMQRVFWKLEAFDDDAAKIMWIDEYEPIKDRWNIHVYIHRNKLSKLLSEPLAFQLVGPDNSRQGETSDQQPSVHTLFVKAHGSLKQLLLNDDKAKRADLTKVAHDDLDTLSAMIDGLTADIFDAYLSRYDELRSLGDQ